MIRWFIIICLTLLYLFTDHRLDTCLIREAATVNTLLTEGP